LPLIFQYGSASPEQAGEPDNMNPAYHWLFPGAWIAFAAYWAVSTLRLKKARQSEPFLARLVYLVSAAVTIALVASPGLPPATP
jgi:hypothetical protein